jgi:hypothetical protein
MEFGWLLKQRYHLRSPTTKDPLAAPPTDSTTSVQFARVALEGGLNPTSFYYDEEHQQSNGGWVEIEESAVRAAALMSSSADTMYYQYDVVSIPIESKRRNGRHMGVGRTGTSV